MRILVLGAGGIGGYFGGRLAESGADVTFLVRPTRAERIRADGLIIQSPLGDAVVKVRTVTRETLDRGYDLILFTCKAYDLESAIAAIRPAVTSVTSILPLLNGLAHLDGLDTTFGADAVLGGLAHISTTLAPDGRILHLNRLQALTYGARSAGQRARSDAVEKLLRHMSFEQRHSAAIMQEMWEKFAFITAAAAITCLMRAPIGHILEAADGERLILKMLTECEAVAAASGFAIGERAHGWAKPFLTQRGSEFTASMLRDLRNGAKVEADHLQGDMIRRGNQLGVGVELLRVAYCHLQAYENGRARTGAQAD